MRRVGGRGERWRAHRHASFACFSNMQMKVKIPPSQQDDVGQGDGGGGGVGGGGSGVPGGRMKSESQIS